MLMSLKDIQNLTGYSHTVTGYQMLRQAGIEAADYRKQVGKGAPVNLYRSEDVVQVFEQRLRRIGKLSANGQLITN